MCCAHLSMLIRKVEGITTCFLKYQNFRPHEARQNCLSNYFEIFVEISSKLCTTFLLCGMPRKTGPPIDVTMHASAQHGPQHGIIYLQTLVPKSSSRPLRIQEEEMHFTADDNWLFHFPAPRISFSRTQHLYEEFDRPS